MTDREKLPMDRPRRCGARTRDGNPCRSPAVRGKRRCRMHGGAAGSGAPIGNKNAFCGALDCGVASAGPYDLSTTGDLVRARLTIKTQGYGFLWAGPAPAY